MTRPMHPSERDALRAMLIDGASLFSLRAISGRGIRTLVGLIPFRSSSSLAAARAGFILPPAGNLPTRASDPREPARDYSVGRHWNSARTGGAFINTAAVAVRHGAGMAPAGPLVAWQGRGELPC